MDLLLLFDMPNFASAEVWLSLLTLTFLEIVLGIDNIIFIAIAAGKLPEKDQKKATNIICSTCCNTNICTAAIYRAGEADLTKPQVLILLLFIPSISSKSRNFERGIRSREGWHPLKIAKIKVLWL